MRPILFFIAYLFLSHLSPAQNTTSQNWVRFEDTTTLRFGFKDLQGNIKINAIYWDCPTDTFKTIAFVGIDNEGWVCINKKQEILFRPYICDNGIDIFQSGLIRIQENKKMGFANSDGKVVIPAVYDFVTPFDNCYAAFLTGGKYVCGDKEVPDTLCEHMQWAGGSWGIINKNADTLIPPSINDSIFNLQCLNISSLTDSMPNACYLPVKGVSQTYFIEDVEKSFKQFFTDFLHNAETMNVMFIKAACLSHIKCTYCLINTQQEYAHLVKTKQYIPGYYHTLNQAKEVMTVNKFIHEDLNIVFSRKALAALRDSSITQIFIDNIYCDYLFSFENDALFLKHLSAQNKYYKITAVVTHKENAKAFYQEHYEFLKTDTGFKFIGYDRTLDGYGK